MTLPQLLALGMVVFSSRVVSYAHYTGWCMNVFDAIGGEPTVDCAVDVFYARMTADPELSRWFVGVDLGRLKERQRAFPIVSTGGGPEHDDGRSMRESHLGLGITDEVYTVPVEHLATALVGVGVPEPFVKVTVGRIESMRVAIIELR